MNIEHYQQLEEKIKEITNSQNKIASIINPGIYSFVLRKIFRQEKKLPGLLEKQLQNIEQTANILNTVNRISRSRLVGVIKDYDRNLKELYEYSQQSEKLDAEIYNLKITTRQLNENNKNKFLVKNKKINLERAISEKTHLCENINEYVKAKEEEESILALEEKYQRRALHWLESFQNKIQLIYSHLQRTRNLAKTLNSGNIAKDLFSGSIDVLNDYVTKAIKSFSQGIKINPEDHRILIVPEVDVSSQVCIIEAEEELNS